MRTKHNSKKIRTLRRRHLALALVTAMAAPLAMAQNLPQSGTVVPGSGSATIGQSGNTMTITQATKGAIIDWYSFDIGTGYGVTFDQQFGASSVTLNRVIGFSQSPSMINGALNANGNVFIINPAGIMFGNGAQANVGGLVASSLDIDNADFLTGVSTGQYRFTTSGSVAGAIWNNGQLTAADGGTIGLIGSKINNAGTITANNGSVVFGATRDVTLDYFGDGLTQVTVSGNGLGVSNCQTDCNGGITSSGNVFAGGGHIEMHSNTMDGASAGNALFVDPANGGRVWISGNVAARTSGARRGSVVIDAGMGNIDLGGVQGRTGNVSANGINAGEQAGTIELRGNQLFVHLCIWTNNICQNNNALGLINATTYGGGGLAGGTIDIDVARFYHAGVIQASSGTGPGGTVNINAESAEIYNLVMAESIGGVGGTINITADNLLLHRGQTPWLGGPGTLYSLATLSTYGATSGGTVNLDAGSLSMIDLGNVAPGDVNLEENYRPTINANGFDGNGGNINITTTDFTLSPWQYFEATGTQAGGNIAITANSINLAGGLVATGATGGSVTTTTTGSLFAAATAYIKAGTWLVHAPSIEIIPTSGNPSGTGASLTDDALSSTLDGGTVVQLYADAALATGATGAIRINDGVDIVHATADTAALDLRATAGIYASEFNIESTGGPLDLSFVANVQGINPTEGYVSFSGATLTSNGGDVVLDGDGSGVELGYSQISSGVGDITITGTATGSAAIGVSVNESAFASTSGAITITGNSPLGEGVTFAGTGGGITTTSGAIVVSSTGLLGLNVADVPFSTDTGDITLEGHALGGGFGVSVGAGGLVSNGGAITLIGSSVDSTGVFVNGGDITSGGGDITIDGSSTNQVGVQIAGSEIDSAGGNIVINGEGLSSTGLIVSAAQISGGAGDINLNGKGGPGAGVSISQLSSVSTTSGNVSIAGTSISHDGVALDIGDVTTTSGTMDITGTGGTGGVRILDGSLSTTSGDINIAGVGGSGAGLTSGAGSSINAGSGLLELIAGNDGSSDAIVLQGSIASSKAVNLRPIGASDTILLGAGNRFSLSNAELAMIDSPLLIIGSNKHAGVIRVSEAMSRNGNLTLQNQGGSGGIDIQAALNVGNHTLALASGGNISQTAAGGITARDLLAIAGGNVALTAAENNVAASSLAGSAGGDFAYGDVDELAIGEVASFGFNTSAPTGVAALSATGITAQGDVLVRTASGNLTLGANVSGRNIDLVSAGLFFNPTSAVLNASNKWRIWSATWKGEERGGLQGDGPFDIYGCTFGQDCLGVGVGNRFIYVEPRLVRAPLAPASVAEWLDEDALDGTAVDLLLGGLCPVADASSDLLRVGTSNDELGQEWQKSRRRLQLSNCIETKTAPGCRF